jgi:hypothetical protein
MAQIRTDTSSRQITVRDLLAVARGALMASSDSGPLRPFARRACVSSALENNAEANDSTQGPRAFRIGGSRSARWSAARVITFLGGATSCTWWKGAAKVVLRNRTTLELTEEFDKPFTFICYTA